MAYSANLREAANRHYQDACKLFKNKRFDNAGYHFGIAAECAIKQKLQETGVRRGNEAMWEHFPYVRNTALQAVSGRSPALLRNLLESNAFLQGWNIKMRYAGNGAIDSKMANRWRDDANKSLSLLS
ncbi:MAG: HEPN domain-containing protein [Gammaproteobacteria bacterium]|nr:HEPN domain-containing protein [Gammaproteobacteria bacterium]